MIGSLADFKRWLATPGATVQVIHHWRGDGSWLEEARRRAFFSPRTVKTLQTNGVYFSDNSFLGFGKAKDWSFKDDCATVQFGGPHATIVYKLTGGRQ